MKTFDIYLVGVGGQGVLTIANVITNAAVAKDIPINYYPTKGMAQRGGFVKVQLRLGRPDCGPDITEKGADLVISLERSESLYGVRYLKEGGEFLVYDNIWAPTPVMLGKSTYPSLAEVRSEIEKNGGLVRCLSGDLPEYNGKPVRDNIYVLGAAFGSTKLKEIISIDDVKAFMTEKWPKAADANLFTFEAGMNANIITTEQGE